MRTEKPQRIVITGGPGSGKTTLIDALSGVGYRCMPEAGRAIIREQLAVGGRALPWEDREAFAERMLQCELRSYHEAPGHDGPVIFDRGIPDILGYLRLSDLPVKRHVMEAARRFRYFPRVFLAPHWPAIFEQDAERKQSETEAARTCQVMEETYASLGYEIVPLPLDTVEARVRFVSRHL